MAGKRISSAVLSWSLVPTLAFLLVACGDGGSSNAPPDARAFDAAPSDGTPTDVALSDGTPTDAAPFDGTPADATSWGDAEFPPLEDWSRDILSTDLALDLTTLEGTATVTLAGAASHGASFEVGDLTIAEVSAAGQPLAWEAGGGQVDVGVPPTGDVAVTFRYHFSVHSNFDGYLDTGVSFLWPYYCGNLFPCKSAPDDGLTFTLALTGVPAGRVAVYPAAIPGPAPSYMVAFATGSYTREILGTTTAGTEVSVWYLTGGRTAALAGTDHLTAAFDWLETTLGPYTFGSSVGSVAVSWGLGAYGGMEHHPYWHVANSDMDTAEVHIHEAAHGWFGDGIRIRCWEDFVLSEGVTSYLAALAIEAVYGSSTADALWQDYQQQLDWANTHENTVAWPTGCNQIDILTSGLFGVTPYMKGAFFLRAVEQQVGRSSLVAALRAFYTARVGQAAGMQDLLDTIESVTGFDPTALADTWLRS